MVTAMDCSQSSDGSRISEWASTCMHDAPMNGSGCVRVDPWSRSNAHSDCSHMHDEQLRNGPSDSSPSIHMHVHGFTSKHVRTHVVCYFCQWWFWSRTPWQDHRHRHSQTTSRSCSWSLFGWVNQWRIGQKMVEKDTQWRFAMEWLLWITQEWTSWQCHEVSSSCVVEWTDSGMISWTMMMNTWLRMTQSMRLIHWSGTHSWGCSRCCLQCIRQGTVCLFRVVWSKWIVKIHCQWFSPSDMSRHDCQVHRSRVCLQSLSETIHVWISALNWQK